MPKRNTMPVQTAETCKNYKTAENTLRNAKLKPTLKEENRGSCFMRMLTQPGFPSDLQEKTSLQKAFNHFIKRPN